MRTTKIIKSTKKTDFIGKEFVVNIHKQDSSGTGITYINNKTCAVMGSMDGEKLKVKIYNQKDNFLEAHIVEVLESSNFRIAPFCQHFDICGGCDNQICDKNQLFDIKIASLEKRLQQNINKIYNPNTAYRRRIRLAYKFDKKLKIGFREKNNNNICEIDNCLIATQNLQNVIPKLIAFLQTQQYLEIGHLELLDVNKVVLLVNTIKPIKNPDQLLKFAHEHNIALFFANKGELQCDKTQTNELFDKVLDCKIIIKPNAFLQANSYINEQIIHKVLEYSKISNTQKVLDLFCGFGNFSLPFAGVAKKVLAVEANKEMLEVLALNCALNNIVNVDVLQANLFIESNFNLSEFDVVFLDPPRDGALNICKQLQKLKIPKIIYLSCNVETFLIDAKILLENYKITNVSAFDMFSFTTHTELLSVFEYCTD